MCGQGLRRHLPDLLSVARALLAPAIPRLVRTRPRAAVVILSACALTDIADGYFARRWQAARDFGARLDSYADVVFFLSVGEGVLRTLGPGSRAWVTGCAGVALGIGSGLVILKAPPVVLAPGAILAAVGAAQELAHIASSGKPARNRDGSAPEADLELA